MLEVPISKQKQTNKAKQTLLPKTAKEIYLMYKSLWHKTFKGRDQRDQKICVYFTLSLIWRSRVGQWRVCHSDSELGGVGLTYLRLSSDSGSLVSFSGIRICFPGRSEGSFTLWFRRERQGEDRETFLLSWFRIPECLLYFGIACPELHQRLEVLNLCAQHYVFV